MNSYREKIFSTKSLCYETASETFKGLAMSSKYFTEFLLVVEHCVWKQNDKNKTKMNRKT
jgi:hypothetical protein